eukprot:SAG11_NODE_196_length_12778_cov_6.887767_6_plen_147_part_00
MDATFVGQWALTVQSAWDTNSATSFFPLVTKVLQQAQAVCDAADAGTAPPAVLPLAQDLAAAWVAVVGTRDQALTIEGRRRRLSPEARLALGEWMVVIYEIWADRAQVPHLARHLLTCAQILPGGVLSFTLEASLLGTRPWVALAT